MKLYFKPIFLIGEGGSGGLVPPGFEGSAPGGDAGGEETGGGRAINSVRSLDQTIDVLAAEEPKVEAMPEVEVVPEIEVAPIEVAPVDIPLG